MEHDIKKLIKGVLEKGYLVSLGTADESGVWVSDVIYIFDDDFNLYWMSDSNVRHSKAILNNPQVAGTITVNLPKENNLGVQFEGVAEKIEGARYDLAKKHYTKRKKPEPKEDDDILQGDSWYVLRPKKIELICEEFFQFNKQKVEFN